MSIKSTYSAIVRRVVKLCSSRRRTFPVSMSSAAGAWKSTKSSKVTSTARPALSNITNQRHVPAPVDSDRDAPRGSSKIVRFSMKIVSVKKGPSTNASLSGLPASSVKQNVSDAVLSKMIGSTDISDSSSVSMDESMSICDSMKSSDIEYMDINEMGAVDSIKQIVDVDDDPQLCATIACDIYKHLRASEANKRPATDFMERVQKDINASMRAILIDWLVVVAEKYKLAPDTLYLTVNYIDRYLSGSLMDGQRLQLLGVSCMMIASKYEEIRAPRVEEEIRAPRVEEFCHVTDDTYFEEEVLEMESTVLNYLKFEMTAPTAKCFLRRFVRAAQGLNEAPSLQLECLANYIAELSLLEYSMLSFAPSLIAASSIFLAKYILFPSKTPWDSTLHHYTLYQPFELRDCVIALHGLCCNNQDSSLPAIREKYSQHKHKFVAKKYCPPYIPSEYFCNLSS